MSQVNEGESDRYRILAEKTRFIPGEPTKWRFEIVGPSGPPKSYRVQHERELHLIVVRDDLTTFSHLHPERDDLGAWGVDLELPLPGSYTAFADVAPDDVPATTLRLKLIAEGVWTPSEVPAGMRSATIDDYLVELSGDVVASEGSTITFIITRGEEVVTTDPYLGAAGHLVAIKTRDLDYLHVHPIAGDEPGAIPFMIHAPSAGTYRLFLQFLHAGMVRTVDFTVHAMEPRDGEGNPEAHHG